MDNPATCEADKNDAEAQDMEDKEREILAALAYPDPYQGEGAA
jgi:ssRNA-specific RNase YbeY (16S rRNA maturation enzyme)